MGEITIAVFTTADDVPEKFRAVAHLFQNGKMLPMRFAAADAETVRNNAADWLAAEREIERMAEEKREARALISKAARELRS